MGHDAPTLTRISSPAATTQVSPCLDAPTMAMSLPVGSATDAAKATSNQGLTRVLFFGSTSALLVGQGVFSECIGGIYGGGWRSV